MKKENEEMGMTDYRSYEMKAFQRKHYYLTAASALFFLGLLFYQSLWLSLLMMFLAVPMEKRYSLYLAEKRKEELTSQFRDMLYAMSAAVSTGRQLSTAIAEAREQLASAYGTESLLYIELDFMVRSMTESNEMPETLLIDFAQRSGIDEIRQFAHICSICKKTGGDLERVMGKTAEILMEKLSVDREIKMITAQKRFETKILTMIPIAAVLFLNLTSPGHLAILYEGVQGRVVMSLALGGIGAAYFISSRITEISL